MFKNLKHRQHFGAMEADTIQKNLINSVIKNHSKGLKKFFIVMGGFVFIVIMAIACKTPNDSCEGIEGQYKGLQNDSINKTNEAMKIINDSINTLPTGLRALINSRANDEMLNGADIISAYITSFNAGLADQNMPENIRTIITNWNEVLKLAQKAGKTCIEFYEKNLLCLTK